ncbi:MAG TPA: hypothetical protein VG755_37040 [Nannocystaceae bacterium]|nr:hypothetical protein [Nannocystaceae bacterium]
MHRLTCPFVFALPLVACAASSGDSDDGIADASDTSGPDSGDSDSSSGGATTTSSTTSTSTAESSSGDAPGSTGGDSSTGEAPVTGDRYVAVDGADVGDCSVDPCLTFAYAGQQLQSGEVLVVGDGVYPDAIDATTFPRGAAGAATVIRAAHRDAATITGVLSLYENDDLFLELVDLRFEGPDSKSVAAGNVRFVRATFVGGPPEGNTVNFAIGTNDFAPGAWDVSCEDCIFRGLGGRYAVLVYRATNVVLTRAVARKDGGWGEGAAESDPEGVITFYEASDSRCEQCVALDGLKQSGPTAEALGALVQNSHTDEHTNVAFVECLAIANAFPGIAFEGNGSVGSASVMDSYSVANTGNGITANVDGTIALTRIASLGNGGSGVASYGDGSVSLDDSIVGGNGGSDLDGVSGSTNGAGPAAIDLGGFDSDRIRAELCDRAGETRGLCATDDSFQAYLESHMDG